MNGIVGCTAQTKDDHVLIESSYGGVIASLYTKSFNELSDWLTDYYPNSFHVVWDLSSFANVIFSLLPLDIQTQLKTKTKVFYEDTKIFSTDRWLGITKTTPLHGNFVEKRENNFFGISHWMPSGTDIPKDATEVAQYGEEIIAGLYRIGIYPEKLTSPIGLLSDFLRGYDLPTIYSNKKIIDACEYCLPMMRNEWRSAFKLGFFPKVYSYDMMAGYPSVIARLPNTNNCRIQFSDSYIKSDWAIVCGEIEVWADISPFVVAFDDNHINPKGKWQGYFTKDEINWLLRRKLGTFKMIDGYFIDWLSLDKPYKEPVAKLFGKRDKNDKMVNNLAKRACFTSDTEVLTTNGLVQVSNLSLRDLVYSINPKTLKTEIKPIIGLQQYPYQGGMVQFSNCRHDFVVTPEHKMLLRRDCGKDYKFVQAGSLSKLTTSQWIFPPFSHIEGDIYDDFSLWPYLDKDAIIHIKPNKKYSSTFEKDNRFRHIGRGGYHSSASHIKDPYALGKEGDCQILVKNVLRSHSLPWHFKLDDWLELLGWYISEGCTYQARSDRGRGILITNNNPKPIYALLDRMRLPYGRKINKYGCAQIKIAHHAIYNYCVQECGKGAENKRIPKTVFALDALHLKFLWESLMDGDGCRVKYKRTAKYTTISKRLAYDFQRLCLHLGYNTQVKLEHRTGKDMTRNNKDIYRVFIYKHPKYYGASTIKRRNINLIPYNGTVWGVEVADNHTIIAGRNGKLQFAGQSQGLSGKIDQDNQDGSLGELYNPILAAMTRSRCRLAVADFIYDNDLLDDLLATQVDGCETLKEVQLENNSSMGSWRLDSVNPALIAGKGEIWKPDKKPLNISYNEIIEAIKSNPKRSYYEFGDRYIDLMVSATDLDRQYKDYPLTGGDLLDKVFESSPLDIGTFLSRI